MHLPSELNPGHGRLRQGRRAHRVDHMPAHHSLAAGHDGPVVDALRTAGSGRGSLAADGPEGGRETCYGSGRNSVGTGPGAGHHSRAEEAVRRGHATAGGMSSTVM